MRITNTELAKKVEEVRTRVYNGLAKEIREEVKQEISGIQKLILGLLISIVLTFGGIIAAGQWAASKATDESMRNYKAIVEIGEKLNAHIIISGGRSGQITTSP